MATLILIADDDPVVRLILTAILEAQGHTVESVESGSACIRYISEHCVSDNLPTAVFLDHLLQDMTGLDVLRQIRKLTEAVGTPPVAMLSANTKEEILDLAPDVTPDYFLEKPFTADAVAKVLDAMLPEKR